MKFGRSRHPQEASFDLTPMVDVVLLLIIFFTMTSQFARTEQKMLDLPKQVGDPTRPALPAALFIDMDRDGSLSVLGVPKTLAEVAREVEQETLRSAGALDLVVRAHRACPAIHLNRLAETLAGVGVRNWKLATAVVGGGGAP